MADHILPMPNLHSDASLNPNSPKTPKSPIANRLSLSNTPSASPKLVAAPISPVHSITTELDHTPVVSPRTSTVPSTFLETSHNRNIDRFDALDSENEAAANSMSEFSDYPEGSDVGIKSPPPRRATRTNNFNDDSTGTMFLDTAGPGSLRSFPDSVDLTTNGSTTAIKSQRKSTSEQAIPADGERKVSGDSRISDVNEVSAAVPPIFPEALVIPEALGDSPTLGRYPMTMMVEPPKALPTKPLARNWSTKAQRAPSPIEDGLAATPTDKSADKGRNLPFFSELLGLKSENRGNEGKRKSMDMEVGDLVEVDEAPKSFFNPDSSDEEVGESPVVVHAKQASITRPAVVDHSPNRQSTGFREMQRGRQRTPSENNPGPSRAKAIRIVGEDVNVVGKIDVKRGNIVGTPPAIDADVQDTEGGGESAKRLDIWKKPVPNFTDGLRSHPMQPPIPEKSQRRKVSFPLPPLIEVKPEHRSLRQSIVSTPYPDTPANGEGGEQQFPSSGQALPGNTKPKAVLTLILYSHGNRAPRIKKIIIPDLQEFSLVDTDEKGPQYQAALTIDFDDEKLFKLFRTFYAGMRGHFRTAASARSPNSLKLVSYTALSQLATRHPGPVFQWTLMCQDGSFAEQKWLDLYKKPSLGRGRHEWTDWIKSHPSNTAGKPSQEHEEKLALEITEGWCLSKIAFAITAVLLLSLAATFLWTFSGHKITLESVIGAKGGFKESEIELEGKAGDRLAAGVALGVLVLLLGWTGIGGWALLSWIGT